MPKPEPDPKPRHSRAEGERQRRTGPTNQKPPTPTPKRKRRQKAKRQKTVGCFTDEKMAALAYDKAARELFGETFSKLNFPNGIPDAPDSVDDEKEHKV